jgi:hypothetical protein
MKRSAFSFQGNPVTIGSRLRGLSMSKELVLASVGEDSPEVSPEDSARDTSPRTRWSSAAAMAPRLERRPSSRTCPTIDLREEVKKKRRTRKAA